jgi:hypothetical protein
MLTIEGKTYIKRYLANQVGTIAESIAIGLGNTPENSLDDALNFEVDRVDIDLTTYDFTTDRLIFKAGLSEEYSGVIYEVGLWSLDTNFSAGEYQSRILLSFDSVSEDWSLPTNAAWGTTAARLGADNLQHSPATSATVTSSLQDLYLDLSGYSQCRQLYAGLQRRSSRGTECCSKTILK